MNKLDQIKKRNKLKSALLAKGYSNEQINSLLHNKGYYNIEKNQNPYNTCDNINLNGSSYNLSTNNYEEDNSISNDLDTNNTFYIKQLCGWTSIQIEGHSLVCIIPYRTIRQFKIKPQMKVSCYIFSSKDGTNYFAFKIPQHKPTDAEPIAEHKTHNITYDHLKELIQDDGEESDD